MPRDNWNGSRVTKAIRRVVTRDQGICAYCEHPGANSLDHILPAKDYPHLEWDPHNWAAVHLHGAGTQGGCNTNGCVCPGNKGRGRTPIRNVIRYVRAALCTCPCTCGKREPHEETTTSTGTTRQW